MRRMEGYEARVEERETERAPFTLLTHINYFVRTILVAPLILALTFPE